MLSLPGPKSFQNNRKASEGLIQEPVGPRPGLCGQVELEAGVGIAAQQRPTGTKTISAAA